MKNSLSLILFFKQKEERLAYPVIIVSHSALWKICLSGMPLPQMFSWINSYTYAKSAKLLKQLHQAHSGRLTTHVLWHMKNIKHVLGISASVLDRRAHCFALGRSQPHLPLLFELWNPGPVLRDSRERGAAFSQPCCARLEERISHNLALSSYNSRDLCQVPVFGSPLYQVVVSSFPGLPATFQSRTGDGWDGRDI